MQKIAALLFAVAPSAAFAQAAEAAAPAAGSPLASMLPLVLVFFVFYFLLVRPQQKRMKEHQALLGALKKGDEVVTGGGLVGRITKLEGADRLVIEIAKGVEVVAIKSTVSGLVSASAAPVVDKKKSAAGNKNDNLSPGRASIANDN